MTEETDIVALAEDVRRARRKLEALEAECDSLKRRRDNDQKRIWQIETTKYGDSLLDIAEAELSAAREALETAKAPDPQLDPEGDVVDTSGSVFSVKACTINSDTSIHDPQGQEPITEQDADVSEPSSQEPVSQVGWGSQVASAEGTRYEHRADGYYADDERVGPNQDSGTGQAFTPHTAISDIPQAEDRPDLDEAVEAITDDGSVDLERERQRHVAQVGVAAHAIGQQDE